MATIKVDIFQQLLNQKIRIKLFVGNEQAVNIGFHTHGTVDKTDTDFSWYSLFQHIWQWWVIQRTETQEQGMTCKSVDKNVPLKKFQQYHNTQETFETARWKYYENYNNYNKKKSEELDY